MSREHLEGKIALITGASSGIGAAAARALAAEGVHVVITARRTDRLTELAAELGDSATPLAMDVTDPATVAAVFAQIRTRFGGLDLLFNNAGLGFAGAFTTSTAEEWRRMLDTNVMGLLACTQAAIPLMKGRAGAMICSTASTGGRYGVENWSVYCATKFAVVGFSETLRKELAADGIRVTTIEPGAVWTEFGHNVPPEALAARRTELEALQPEDIGNALVYAFGQHPRVLVQALLVRPVRQSAP